MSSASQLTSPHATFLQDVDVLSLVTQHHDTPWADLTAAQQGARFYESDARFHGGGLVKGHPSARNPSSWLRIEGREIGGVEVVTLMMQEVIVTDVPGSEGPGNDIAVTADEMGPGEALVLVECPQDPYSPHQPQVNDHAGNPPSSSDASAHTVISTTPSAGGFVSDDQPSAYVDRVQQLTVEVASLKIAMQQKDSQVNGSHIAQAEHMERIRSLEGLVTIERRGKEGFRTGVVVKTAQLRARDEQIEVLNRRIEALERELQVCQGDILDLEVTAVDQAEELSASREIVSNLREDITALRAEMREQAGDFSKGLAQQHIVILELRDRIDMMFLATRLSTVDIHTRLSTASIPGSDQVAIDGHHLGKRARNAQQSETTREADGDQQGSAKRQKQWFWRR